MINIEKTLKEAIIAEKESKTIEFKSEFNTDSSEHLCEIVKDIVAIANSGGGIILIGVDDHGVPNKNEVAHILKLDPAFLVDKIYKYTRENFSNFEIVEIKKGGESLAAMKILPSESPILFEKPGTYDIGEGKQKTAFSKGTAYFRHGAKSEPGTTNDIKNIIKREVRAFKKYWIRTG